MALSLSPGLTPSEVAFLCEMEMITVVPRQRLESLHLLGGATPPLRPPHRAVLPLWLALLLKRQRRANIIPPAWLHPASLDRILKEETASAAQSAFTAPPPHPYPISSQPRHTDSMTPPFLPSNTVEAPPNYLPYHWLELSEILLEACSDDILDVERVRTLLRDLREIRQAKMIAVTKDLGEKEGVVSLLGVGAMELSESRSFITGVVDGLRKLGASREATRRTKEAEGGDDDDSDDNEMDYVA